MKKIIFPTALALLLSICVSAQYNGLKTPAPLPGTQGEYLPQGIDLHYPGANPFTDRPWELVFSDEFNDYSGAPDNQKWVVSDNEQDPPWMPFVGTTSSNDVWVSNGACILRQNYNGNYTHGVISTRTYEDNPKIPEPLEWETGRFEARIKLANAYWSHNTFWLISNGELGSEVDIVEYLPYKGKQKLPSHFHNYIYCSSSGNHNTYDVDNEKKMGYNLYDDWHIYTLIWDKYNAYIYIDYQLVFRLPKFFTQDPTNNWVQYNAYSTGNYSANNQYRITNGFPDINRKLKIVLSTGLDKRATPSNWWKKMFHKQWESLPTYMFIDWVRVYQRPKCDQSEDVTNSKLLPYHNLTALNDSNLPEQDIKLGSNNTSQTWENIAKPWGAPGIYTAESITLRPNFISEPEWVDATPCKTDDNYWDPNNQPFDMSKKDENTYRPSSSLFIAQSCESSGNGYIESIPENPVDPDISAWDTTVVTDTFDCSNVDTFWVDSMITASLLTGDTLLADSILSYLTDTLGCPYWAEGSGGQGKPGRHSYVQEGYQYWQLKKRSDAIANGQVAIYPNPNNGTFTIIPPQSGEYRIQITDMLGAKVYSGKFVIKEKTTITLTNMLPQGQYILKLTGNGQQYIQKLDIIE